MEGFWSLAVLSIPVAYFYWGRYLELRRTLQWVNSSVGNPKKVNIPLPVHLLRSSGKIEEIFCALLANKQSLPVVGVDAEWKPNQIKGEQAHPVAILQIATPTDIYVIQLLYLDDGIPNSLHEFLKTSEIIKTGVGIIGDARKLQRDHRIVMKGCVELYMLAMHSNLLEGLVGGGLKSLSSHFLDLSLPKDKKVQLSDWSVDKLSKKQTIYAAADAWAGLVLFERLLQLHLQNKCETVNPGNTIALWWKRDQIRAEIYQWVNPVLEQKSIHTGHKNKKQQGKPIKSWRGQDDLSCRKKPLYDGCQMLAPDGSHISYCNKDKIQWYLDKGIAEQVPGSDPAVIKLKFFPSGKTGSESYASEAQMISHETPNRCVVCGNRENYQKFYIVPRCYRQYFPKNEKFHCSHDIILLCPSCHFQCSTKLEEHKASYVSKEYGVPISGNGEQYIVESKGAMVAAGARQLLKNKKKMNEQQIAEREAQIRDYFQCEEITKKILQKATKIKYKKKNPDYLTHGEAVVKILLEKPNELQRFVVMWRRFFEDNLKPKYLPAYWDPNHEWEEQHGSGVRKTPYF